MIAANWGPASKGLVLPTGTPAEIVDAWRKAVEEMTEDAEFIEAAPEYWALPSCYRRGCEGIIGKAVDLSVRANGSSMTLLHITA